jgi:lysophospholipase L1-like esterase
MGKTTGLLGIRTRGGFALAIGIVALTIGSGRAGAQQATASPSATQTPDAKGQISPRERSYLDYAKQEEELRRTDFANLKRFRQEDTALPAPAAGEQRVVFMGDSITQGWVHNGVPPEPAVPGTLYVNRGISGQTTPQMLLRFRQDVIDLKPGAVVIFAGINDIAGNTGDMTAEQTEDNLASMAELAKANGIRVVLCSITPAFDFPWRPGREPAQKVVALNSWIKAYAESHGDVYVDFYSAMVDERGGLPEKLSKDGVHPNPTGYAIMTPLVEAGIVKALGSM